MNSESEYGQQPCPDYTGPGICTVQVEGAGSGTGAVTVTTVTTQHPTQFDWTLVMVILLALAVGLLFRVLRKQIEGHEPATTAEADWLEQHFPAVSRNEQVGSGPAWEQDEPYALALEEAEDDL